MLDDAALWGEVLKFVPVLGALRAQRVAKLFRQAARLEPRAVAGRRGRHRRKHDPRCAQTSPAVGPATRSKRSECERAFTKSTTSVYIPMFASSAQAGR